MLKYLSALFCALLVLSVLEPITCRKFGGSGGSRGGSHSYPSSHGLSGSGRGGGSGGHGYPSSGGSHGYPSSHGLSGSGRGGLSGGQGYPSSGGSHTGSRYPASPKPSYPSSGGGLSGSGSSYPGSHGYPKPSGSNYPASPKPSYPSSGSGLSGSGHSYPNRPSHVSHSTTIHNHYHYNPPRQITYAAPGQRPMSYPVYHGTPPTYVYQYKNSGSKYGTLLAGLALLNLGTLAGAAYVGSRSHSNYKPQPGEICKFAVKKSNGYYEETKIDCQLITSFIFAEEAKVSGQPSGTNSTTVTTTMTNVTVVNNTVISPNGTLVPATGTQINMPTVLPNGTVVTNVPMQSSVQTVTTTTTNTTVVNALDVKGKEIQVTPGMECFVIRHTPTQNMRKPVSCGLLQSYATQSLKHNSAVRNIPTFTILFAITAFILY